jgi:L-lactate utilization protein LutB
MPVNNINDIVSNFQSNGIKCSYFEDVETAKEYIISSVSKEKNIGIGGSKTIYDMGLYDELIQKGKSVYWHWTAQTPEQRKEAFIKSRGADVYLTSSNAITAEGEIVNIDGFGNRVSTMIFGPKKTLIVCGINKLCDNLADALNRIRKTASPPNAKRLNLSTPCSKTGECHDCNSPDRICNVTTIIHKKPAGIEMELILINENLGF